MFWKAGAMDSAAALIKWLLERRAQSGTGSGWPADLRTDLAMQELGDSLQNPVTPFVVMRILTRMGGPTASMLTEFEVAHDQVVTENKAALARMTAHPWRLVLPMKMRLDDSVPAGLSISVDGQTFMFLRYAELGQELSDAISSSRLQQAFHGELMDVRIDEAFIVAEQNASAAEVALDQLYPAFNLLRGVLEYTVSRGEARLISGRQQPRSNLPHPKLVAALSGTTYRALRFDVASHRETHQVFTLRGTNLLTIRNLAELFAAPVSDSSTVAMIADALRLYTQALDATWNYACFVALWQLAELTTSATDVHGATDEVVKRLLWHTEGWPLPGAGLRETLVELGKKRNLIVHKGIHPVSEDEINALKYICEQTIEWLIASRTELPTRSHVRSVYRMRSAPDAELRTQEEAIVFVRQQRQRRQTQST